MCAILNDGYYSCPPDHFKLRHIKTIWTSKGTFSEQKLDTTRLGGMDGCLLAIRPLKGQRHRLRFVAPFTFIPAQFSSFVMHGWQKKRTVCKYVQLFGVPTVVALTSLDNGAVVWGV